MRSLVFLEVPPQDERVTRNVRLHSRVAGAGALCAAGISLRGRIQRYGSLG